MPRFLRPNSAIRGLASSDLITTRKGIYTPAAASGNQIIVPEVIAWPWSADDAGVAFPSGIVGIRSIAAARTTERGWSTPGDPTENQDQWIAVPTTLPGGYTARNARDAGRGRNGGASTRGSVYLSIGNNGAGLGTSAPFNYTDPGGLNAFRMLADWTVNGLGPTSTSDLMPSYRPSGGGGIVKPGWFPLNISQSVLHCIYYELGGGGAYTGPGARLPGISSAVTSLANNNGEMGLWTNAGPGFRAATMRYTAVATPAAWANAANTMAIQFIIGHNADWSKSSYGDTNDYASPVYGKSDFTTDGIDQGSGFRYYTITHTTTSGVTSTAANGMRSWVCGYICNMSSAWASNFTTQGTGPTNPYTKRLWLSPRVDIPAAFSVYGAGIGAPGGV